MSGDAGAVVFVAVALKNQVSAALVWSGNFTANDSTIFTSFFFA